MKFELVHVRGVLWNPRGVLFLSGERQNEALDRDQSISVAAGIIRRSVVVS